jgi:hypothetical protein
MHKFSFVLGKKTLILMEFSCSHKLTHFSLLVFLETLMLSRPLANFCTHKTLWTNFHKNNSCLDFFPQMFLWAWFIYVCMHKAFSCKNKIWGKTFLVPWNARLGPCYFVVYHCYPQLYFSPFKFMKQVILTLNWKTLQISLIHNFFFEN